MANHKFGDSLPGRGKLIRAKIKGVRSAYGEGVRVAHFNVIIDLSDNTFSICDGKTGFSLPLESIAEITNKSKV